MSKLLICDIDGVLADCSHRLHYLEEKNYEAFYSIANMLEDEPIWHGIELFNNIRQNLSSFDIYLLTGRPERTRKITEMWLRYYSIEYSKMFMREDGDYRPSPEVKVDLMKELEERIKRYDKGVGGYFIDDDPENIKAVCKAFPGITGITFGIGRMNNDAKR